MANQNTRWLRKAGFISKVVKGLNRAAAVEYSLFKGVPCITSFNSKDKNPQNKRKSPWRGAKHVRFNEE